MAMAVTLAELIARIRWRADVAAMTARHTDADLALEINKSWTALRTKVSDAGAGLYIKWSTPTAMTVGAASGHSYGVCALPADCVRIYYFDVTVSAGRVVGLEQCSMVERNAYYDQWARVTGLPRFFCVFDIGAESTTTVSAGSIALLPAPDQAYSYTIGYVPAWTNIAAANTTYVFNGFDGWDEWVLLDVTVRIAMRDNDMQQTAALAMAEREKVWLERVLPDTRVSRAGPIRRADTYAQSKTQRDLVLRRGL